MGTKKKGYNPRLSFWANKRVTKPNEFNLKYYYPTKYSESKPESSLMSYSDFIFPFILGLFLASMFWLVTILRVDQNSICFSKEIGEQIILKLINK